MKFLNFISKLNYFTLWGIKRIFFKKKIPLTCSLIITDKCNLNCKHCIVSNLGYKGMSFKDVKRDIKILYNTGCRMLVITGGEPFLWKDNGYNLDDIIKYAKNLGFFRTVVCTNGTINLKSESDYLWVSLDGSPEEHKKLRGDDIYYKILRNILKSNHDKIYINFTISRVNLNNLEESSRRILNYKKIRGILFHIYTPYVGLNDKNLELSNYEREFAINSILKIKKKYPLKISNTYAGIYALKKDKWERPTWASIVLNQGDKSICCCRRGISNQDICKKCGCTPAVETWVLQKMIPSAIIENLRFL